MFKLRADPRVTRVGQAPAPLQPRRAAPARQRAARRHEHRRPAPGAGRAGRALRPRAPLPARRQAGHDRADAGLRARATSTSRSGSRSSSTTSTTSPWLATFASSSRRSRWPCGATARISRAPRSRRADRLDDRAVSCLRRRAASLAHRDRRRSRSSPGGRVPSFPLRGLRHRAHRAVHRGRAPRRGLYEGGTYERPRPAVDRMLEPLRSLVERDKLRFVRDLPGGARVLEVGAGRRPLRLQPGRRQGSTRAGSSRPSRGVAMAHARGAPVERATVEELELEPESPRCGGRLARARAPGRSGRRPGADRRLAAAGRPRRRRLSQPGEPPGPDRRRSLVPSGRAPPPDPLHRAGLGLLLERAGFQVRAHEPSARRAESARDVADDSQPAHAGARRRLPGAEAGPRASARAGTSIWS